MNEKRKGFKLTIDVTDTGEGYECYIETDSICGADLITCLRALCRTAEGRLGKNMTISALMAIIGEQFGMESFQTAGAAMLQVAKDMSKEGKEERAIEK